MYMAKINIYGLLFDEKTGKVTYDDGEVPAVGGDFTFEATPGYNPLQYATDKTGDKIVEILKAALPAGISFKLTKTKSEGPVQPPAQLQVCVERYGITAELNVGLIANSLIRSGSLNAVKADLKTAGLLF